MAEKPLKLKVAEAIQDDVNKGIVRIDSSFMHQVGVRPGDIVQIKGERETVGIVDRAYPGDIGLNIIRMDGIIRRNAKTGIGEIVEVTKADVKEAKKVTIAPAQKGVVVRASPNIFKQGLLGRALSKGDIVSLGGTRRRRTTMSESPFFNDIFSMLDDSVSGFGFTDLKFIVASADPKGAVIITEQTEVTFNPEAVELKEEKVLEVTYEDIGGLDEEIKKIREMVELPLKHPEIFERLGVEPPKGVLLHGPPGTGKTLLAKAVANETNSHFILINGPEIMSKFYGESEANLRKKFEDAEKNAPSIIFFDEVDAIAPKREEVHGEVERRVVAQLLANMDGLQSRGKVVVIAATNRPDDLDPALRRPGRFDREVEIGVPGKDARLSVLKIHTRNMPLKPEYNLVSTKLELKQGIKKIDEEIKLLEIMQDSSVNKESENITAKVKDKKEEKEILKGLIDKISKLKPKEFSDIMETENYDILDKFEHSKIYNILKEAFLKEFSDMTYGFVGADLSSLAKEAAMNVLRRILPDLRYKEEGEPIPTDVLDKLKITKSDFKEALKVVRPSAMREVLVEVPNVRWDDIGGMDDVKQELKEAVEWPLKHPEVFTRLGVRPPRGILLYGAPGTGKTMLAKAVANESQANFILVKGPEMLSKWVGESERAIRKIFKKARQTSPTIIFFDEMDSIAPRRGAGGDNNVTERVVNQLLTEIDGLEELNDVVVIAATNRPDIIDTGLLRKGRFDRIIQTTAPDLKSREMIFKIHTSGMSVKLTKEEEKEMDNLFKGENILSSDIISKIAVDETVNEKDVSTKKLSSKEKVEFKKLNSKEKLIYYLASKTDGYAGADIEAICREAAILTLRDDIKAKEVTKKYFDQALEKVYPSITAEIKKSYDDMSMMFSSAKGREFQKEKPNYFG